jgi:hypothetical protein
MDLVGDQAVGLAMDAGCGVGVRRVDQAEDLAVALVGSVPQMVNAMASRHVRSAAGPGRRRFGRAFRR